MTVLLQVASSKTKQLHTRLHCKLLALALWSPNGTFCPKARGLSPQHDGEQAPCLLAARPCFLCLLGIGRCKTSAVASSLQKLKLHSHKFESSSQESVHPKLKHNDTAAKLAEEGIRRVSPVQFALAGVLTA